MFLKKLLLVILILSIGITLFSNSIVKVENFLYNSDLTAFEPLYMEEVYFKKVNDDGSLTVYNQNLEEIKLIGIDMIDINEFKTFCEENLSSSSIFLSYDIENADIDGKKYVYLWRKSVYEGKEIYVFWNAALIINGVCSKSAENTGTAFSFIFDNLLINETGDKDEQTYIYEQLGEIGKFSFHNVTWEMSLLETIYKLNEQLLEQKEDRLKYISNVLGYDCLLYFLFDEEIMKEVRYVFGFSNKENIISGYQKIRKRMVNSYGEPQITKNEENIEKVSYSDTWEFIDTTLELKAETLGEYVYAMILRYKKKL